MISGRTGKKPSPIAFAWHIPWVYLGISLFWLIGVPIRGLYAGWVIARDEMDEWYSDSKEEGK